MPEPEIDPDYDFGTPFELVEALSWMFQSLLSHLIARGQVDRAELYAQIEADYKNYLGGDHGGQGAALLMEGVLNYLDLDGGPPRPRHRLKIVPPAAA
jgi:hypothetical protein